MRRVAEGLLAALLAVALTHLAEAEPPQAKKLTPQEKKRQQLLDELGLKKVDAPPPSPPAQPEAPQEPEAAAPVAGERPAAAPAPAAPSFRRVIHPMLLQTCQPCHRAGGPAGATHLLLVGDAAADHATVRALVSLSAPPGSALLVKASGQAHAGGAPWPASGDAHGRVLAWIAKGARLDGGGTPAAPVVSQAPSPAPPPVAPKASPSVHATSPSTPQASPPAPPSVPSPEAAAHQVLMASCAVCHREGGPAAPTRLRLAGDPAADLARARALVDPAAPTQSALVTKATGQLHGGGVVLPPGDPRVAILVAWIETLAAPAPTVATAGAAAPSPAETARTLVATPPAGASAGVPPPAPPSGLAPGLSLGRGFMLDGRFDVAYERRQFSGDPFADSATSALRSYHHFLFLSRESATDPFGLSIEILSLQFWEVHARLGGGARPWRLLLSAGKLLVPFGADPLTHQSYGGLAGFDQKILPPVWAQEGAAAHLTLGRGRLLVTDDAFVVRGYALAHADAVLSLQADFSADDDARLGWGNRLGLSWMNASAWYSAYFNPLGFGRRLFMQAGDLTVWRPRTIPVLGHFSAGAGLLRADVSGGGPGLDYYHFGSYFQLRYHPTDWLYVQYRQGLRTYNNRRGVILDETRLSPDDTSTHNFAVVARYDGLSVTLAYFLILEKAGEVPNDFLRLSVAYDF